MAKAECQLSSLAIRTLFSSEASLPGHKTCKDNEAEIVRLKANTHQEFSN